MFSVVWRLSVSMCVSVSVSEERGESHIRERETSFFLFYVSLFVAMVVAPLTNCAQFNIDSPLLVGLRNILSVGFEYDVSMLALPILLKELQAEVEASNKVYYILS